MTITLTWTDVALRLALTLLAGAAMGFDRGEKGRAAGLRTTILVMLAACIAMLQANWLMNTVGKASDSFVVLDLMRLPLGILSGVGFIGAGAILKRDDLVLGVTTAATLWFASVIGLAFGGGQLALGIVGAILGVLVLSGLKALERLYKQERTAEFAVKWAKDAAFNQQAALAALAAADLQITRLGVKYSGTGNELRCAVRQIALVEDRDIPAGLAALAKTPGVTEIEWKA